MYAKLDCDMQYSETYSQHTICLWSTCSSKMSQLLFWLLEDIVKNSATQQIPVGTFIIKVVTYRFYSQQTIFFPIIL